MDEEEEDDMVDDLDDLLSERPKERRSHSEKDDTFQVDYIVWINKSEMSNQGGSIM